jgi:hypothetical protein
MPVCPLHHRSNAKSPIQRFLLFFFKFHATGFYFGRLLKSTMGFVSKAEGFGSALAHSLLTGKRTGNFVDLISFA